MLQATVCDGCALDTMSFGKDRLGSSKIDVSGRVGLIKYGAYTSKKGRMTHDDNPI
jgi:hypothetical protein